MAHATQLGFSGSIGQLGFMAGAAWSMALIILIVRHKEIPFLNKFLPQQQELVPGEAS